MMQSHIAARKAQGKRPVEPTPQNNIAPVIDLGNRGEGSFRFNQRTGKMERITWSNSFANTQQKALYGDPELPLGVVDEYNPLLPNEFDEFARLKRERRRAEQDRTLRNNLTRRYEDACTDEENSDDDSSSYSNNSARPDKPASAAIAPPPSLVNMDSSGGGAGVSIPPPSSIYADPPPPKETDKQSKFGINQVAAKMMARMGYREGQGLGREGQGMSTALMVEKTGRRAGKIIHERDRPKPGQVEVLQAVPLVPDLDEVDPPYQMPPEPESIPCTQMNTSNVILLQNMCGPGEVDDELEPETAEECAKYGKVKTCMIFEVPDTREDEAVRIFVEFMETEGAIMAINDLNGRYFGGRIVKAGFYDAQKFQNLELSDPILN